MIDWIWLEYDVWFPFTIWMRDVGQYIILAVLLALVIWGGGKNPKIGGASGKFRKDT